MGQGGGSPWCGLVLLGGSLNTPFPDEEARAALGRTTCPHPHPIRSGTGRALACRMPPPLCLQPCSAPGSLTPPLSTSSPSSSSQGGGRWWWKLCFLHFPERDSAPQLPPRPPHSSTKPALPYSGAQGLPRAPLLQSIWRTQGCGLPSHLPRPPAQRTPHRQLISHTTAEGGVQAGGRGCSSRSQGHTEATTGLLSFWVATLTRTLG